MELVKAIKNRKSVRKFSSEKVSDKDLKEIFNLAMRTPSAYNGEQTSVIYTRDENKKREIAKLCNNPHIENCDVFMLLVVDLKRAEYVLGELKEDLENIYDMAKVEAGIRVYALNLLATSYGYGCTIIGAILECREELRRIFNLPTNTFPIIGLTLGVPTKKIEKENTKPKLDSNLVFMEDSYDIEKSKAALKNYENTLNDWYKEIAVNGPSQIGLLKKYLGKEEK